MSQFRWTMHLDNNDKNILMPLSFMTLIAGYACLDYYGWTYDNRLSRTTSRTLLFIFRQTANCPVRIISAVSSFPLYLSGVSEFVGQWGVPETVMSSFDMPHHFLSVHIHWSDSVTVNATLCLESLLVVVHHFIVFKRGRIARNIHVCVRSNLSVAETETSRGTIKMALHYYKISIVMLYYM